MVGTGEAEATWTKSSHLQYKGQRVGSPQDYQTTNSSGPVNCPRILSNLIKQWPAMEETDVLLRVTLNFWLRRGYIEVVSILRGWVACCCKMALNNSLGSTIPAYLSSAHHLQSKSPSLFTAKAFKKPKRLSLLFSAMGSSPSSQKPEKIQGLSFSHV